jgi:glycosyltransferase involved in cell wall biosynthesis
MSAMDILVHPTYREGFSMVIQQAMAMGCAIVTTDIPGPSEVIVDGESGVLVPPYSTEELASAMKDLAQNGEKREFLAQNALERVKTLFNRERMVRLTYENRIKLLTK